MSALIHIKINGFDNIPINVQEHIGKILIELNLWYENCLLPKNIASDTVNHLQLLFLLHIVKEKRKDEIK